jgi:hypothetical protein
MVAEQFTELQKAVGPEITKTDLVPAFQVDLIIFLKIWNRIDVSQIDKNPKAVDTVTVVDGQTLKH